MKRRVLFFSLIPTLTLLSFFNLSPPTSAAEIVDGVKYWSFTEMVTLNLEFDAEMETACGNDYACAEDKLYTYSRQDEQYEALMYFRHGGFRATAINPEQETIKFYYNGIDYMSSSMFGHEARRSIKEIYSVWVEDGIGNPMSNGGWLIQGYRYPYHLTGAEAATHIILDENSAELGDGWFTPNTEREYSTASSHLSQNTTSKIYFSITEDSGGMSNGTISYDTCINSPEYRPGAECRLYFGEDGSTRYLPSSAPNSSNTEVGVAIDTGVVSAELATTTSAQIDVGVGEASYEKTASNKPFITGTDSPSIQAPNTGEATASQGDSTESPWWLGAIFVIGTTTLVWLFWPKNLKNRKLARKIAKKA